jgi:hypothetical protein
MKFIHTFLPLLIFTACIIIAIIYGIDMWVSLVTNQPFGWTSVIAGTVLPLIALAMAPLLRYPVGR